MHFQTDNSKDTEILRSSLVTAYPLCQHRKFIPCFLIVAFLCLMTMILKFCFAQVAGCIIAVNINILFSLLQQCQETLKTVLSCQLFTFSALIFTVALSLWELRMFKIFKWKGFSLSFVEIKELLWRSERFTPKELIILLMCFNTQQKFSDVPKTQEARVS